MIIFIPTYGRPQNQRTYHNLPPELQKEVFMVVQHREQNFRLYLNTTESRLFVLPPGIEDIASTRDYLIEYSRNYPSVVMLDDDLDFAVRRTDEPTKFAPATGDDVRLLFARIRSCLNDVAHAGVSPREGANRNTEFYLPNTRAMRVLGYQPSVLIRHGIKFAPYTFMCDFGVTLELLTRGYGNTVINSFVQNQPGSNTSGGCSSQRTPKKQQEAAEYLKSRFPDFVTIVRKQTKTSWNGEVRYDVRIQWKAAYECGRSRVPAEVLDGRAEPCTHEEGGFSD